MMMMKHHQNENDGSSTMIPSSSIITTHQEEAEKSASKGSNSTWLHRTIMSPDHNRYHEYWHEMKLQLHLAGPMILVNLSQISFQIISCMIVGHLGELALSSCSIATSMANVTGFCFMVSTIFRFLVFVFYPFLSLFFVCVRLYYISNTQSFGVCEVSHSTSVLLYVIIYV